ncbi:MAG: isoprenylcysteine carboxylmethyltransferase family protein [candidate division Zixibacteria bacterium]|nr:isoprenylcysteine carboxylmethyltransferase family protein [candidate division Zixibacteria bacterium]
MDLRAFIFRIRSFTPIPLLAAVLIFADPSLASFFIGLLVALTGELVRLWAVGYTGPATRTRHVGAPTLITDGPYAYVRNPIYVGNFVLSLGLCVMAWAWMPYMLAIFMVAFGTQYALIVSLEEEHLCERFGETYTRYLAHVPRFFPRFSRYPHASKTPFDLIAALRSDRRTFQSMTAVILLIAARWYWGP